PRKYFQQSSTHNQDAIKPQIIPIPICWWPSIKFAPFAPQAYRELSLPGQLERRRSYRLARSEGPQKHIELTGESLRVDAIRAAEAERRELILNLTQPGRHQMLNRTHSGREGLSRQVSHGRGQFSNLRHLSHGQAPNHGQAHRSWSLQGPLPPPIQASAPVARPDRRSALRVQTEPVPRSLWKKKPQHVYAPCHSRAPMAPFLSLPAKVLSTVSRVNPGGSIKTIHKKVRRAVLVEAKKVLKPQKPYGSMPIYGSPEMQKAASKYRVPAQDEDHQVVERFIKTNGVYLEESDENVEEKEEEPIKLDNSTLKKTALLDRIPYTLSFRNPMRSSSVGSTQSSSSSNSNNMSSSNPKTSKSLLDVTPACQASQDGLSL
ncbi:hypothetical protein PSTT_13304, partial [Puccinia striiformis]